ncbi:MAG: xanthine dehydrogenase family protein molybdopterin-binding subunit [Oscillospiraceae bacterium]|nr:xanthine dehydrogenase family protein molybdopterin-binding subunit [Oscillospiraceae bacterium]
MYEKLKEKVCVSEHSQYRYIGKHENRADGEDLVSGRRQFLDDISLPGLLSVRVLRSPYPNANITRIDVEKARTAPGVVGVATYKEAPDWFCGLPHHRRVLDSHVRFVGDSVALVAAETEEQADEALKLIEVEYEELPFVLDCEEALKDGAPQLYEQFKNNEIEKVTPFSEIPFNQIFVGDTEKAFKESKYVAEGVYSYEGLAHPLPPESPGVIAQWTNPQAVTVWYNGGAPHLQKFNTESSIPGVAVRVIASASGGSYGSKQLIPHLVLQACLMAKITGRPCKLLMDRTDHLLSYELRQGSRIRGKVGMTEEGIVNAVEGMWYTDSGMSSTYAQAMTAVGLGECQAFLGKCKDWALDTKLVATNHSSQAPIRGFGGQECKSVLVPLVCTAIRAAGKDPFEVFRDNFVKDGDRYIWRDNLWWDVRSIDYTKACDETARVFGWKDKWKGWETPSYVSPDGRYAIGVGVGVHGNADIGEDPTEAMVKLHPFGSATLELCVAETGGAQRHAVQKMVAEVLNVPIDGVQVVDPDTHGTGYDAGMIGSRGTITMGTCSIRAAKDAKRQLLQRASEMLNVDVDELDTADFFVFHKHNKKIYLPWIAVFGTPEMTITGIGKYKQNFDKPNFALYMAEVGVNLETGEAKLLRAVEGTDVGQIIDPINVRMQAEGSFGSAGADTGLFEEMVMDKKLGRFLTGNMIDYKWRTFNNFPRFDAVILESLWETESFKAVGFGEISPSPAPAAILMAVGNAIGCEIKDYPCTPQAILRAMGKIK